MKRTSCLFVQAVAISYTMKITSASLLSLTLSSTLLVAVGMSATCLTLSPAQAQRYGDTAQDQQSGLNPDYAGIVESRLQALEEQVQRLTNDVEQAKYQAQQAQTRLQRLEEDINVRFRMLEDRASTSGPSETGSAPNISTSSGNTAQGGFVPDSNAGHDATTALNNAEASGNNSNDSRVLGLLLQQSGGQDAPPSSTAGGFPDDPDNAYDLAFSKVRAGDYEAAEAAMREFIQRWPKNDLSSNASYWLAETYYVRGNYDQAVRSFAECYQNYPKGAKAEDTLVKLGITLSVLNRTNDACVTFSQAEKEFPSMSATNRRRMEQERKTLNCQQ